MKEFLFIIRATKIQLSVAIGFLYIIMGIYYIDILNEKIKYSKNINRPSYNQKIFDKEISKNKERITILLSNSNIISSTEQIADLKNIEGESFYSVNYNIKFIDSFANFIQILDYIAKEHLAHNLVKFTLKETSAQNKYEYEIEFSTKYYSK